MNSETNNAAGAGCISQLVSHLIYGDIEEMPLSILGDDCPDTNYYNTLDREQQVRLAAAATVLAWSQGRLHPSGFLFVYALNGVVKCFSADEIRPIESAMLADGWKHTATIDPARWIEAMANGSNDPSDMLDEIQFTQNTPAQPPRVG